MELHSKNKVLITGIEGFTGTHLRSYLKNNGFEVLGTALNPKDAETSTLDINQLEDVKRVLNDLKPDYIVHLAAISYVGHPEILDFYRVNTIGTENILKALVSIEHIPKKILIPSSATVYGNQESSILHEGMTPIPSNHYGCSKLAMEKIIANYYDKIPVIIVRPFNYTGPNQSSNFLIPKLVDHFKQKRSKIFLGNINVKREFNNIGYISEIYKRLLLSSAHSTIVNACSSVSYSINNILKELEWLTNHSIAVEVNPDFIRKNEIYELKGSIEKLSKLIEVPEPLPLEVVLREMLDS